MLVITELEFLFFKQKLKSIATAALLIFPNFTIILNALSNLLLEEKKKRQLYNQLVYEETKYWPTKHLLFLGIVLEERTIF